MWLTGPVFTHLLLIFAVFCLVPEKSGCCVYNYIYVNSVPTQLRKYPCDHFRNAMTSQHYLALAVGSLPICGFLALRWWGGFFVSTNFFTVASLFLIIKKSV